MKPTADSLKGAVDSNDEGLEETLDVIFIFDSFVRVAFFDKSISVFAFSALHTLRNLRTVEIEGDTKKLTAKYVKPNVKNTQVICEKKESVSN